MGLHQLLTKFLTLIKNGLFKKFVSIFSKKKKKKKKIVSMNIEEIIVYRPKLYPFFSYPLNNENAHLIGTIIQ